MKKVIIFCFLLAGYSSLAQDPSHKTDLQLIGQLRISWAQNLQHKQLEKAIDQYTDNAIFYSPGGDNAIGKPAIKKLYQYVMKISTSNCRFISSGVQISGVLAYDAGDYDEESLDIAKHKTQHFKGSYLMVLQKQKDGNWKISRIMWTEKK